MKKEELCRGLYVPQLESDACGIGMIANLEKEYSHQLVSDALTMLENMEHRGACGCDPESGDGAGILIHVPHSLFVSESLSFDLPEKGKYAVGSFFFPKGEHRDDIYKIIGDAADDLGVKLLGRRKLPVISSILGEASCASEPDIYHLFFVPKGDQEVDDVFERKLLILRKYLTHKVVAAYPEYKHDLYVPSLSTKTIIYKGQLTSGPVSYTHLTLPTKA